MGSGLASTVDSLVGAGHHHPSLKFAIGFAPRPINGYKLLATFAIDRILGQFGC
jgi:hypothetical protein